MRFRYNVAVPLTGLAATIALIPLAGNLWYLSPLLLAGVLATAWGFRAGTDIDETGLTVRALFGSRHRAWRDVTGFTTEGRRVYAILAGDRTLGLTAVQPGDVPRLIEAGGQHLERDDQPEPDSQPEPDGSEPEPDDGTPEDSEPEPDGGTPPDGSEPEPGGGTPEDSEREPGQ